MMTILHQAATAAFVVLFASIVPAQAERPRECRLFGLAAALRRPYPRRVGARRAGQVRGRGRTPPHRGRHGPALVLAEKLGNCVIRVVYKTAGERDNSGLYIRVAEKPKDPWYAVHHGFEVQITDSGPEGRGTGSIYTFSKAAARPSKAGEWNTLEVTLKGNRVFTTINGVQVTDFDSSGLNPESPEKTGEGDPAAGPRPESGYIGLQNHDERSIVYFKEVSVRPLGAPSK